jgi:diacylglycerol kinase
VKTTRRAWSSKFADAFRGLRRAVRTQASFFVHVWAAVAVVVVGAVLRVSPVEWCLLIGAIGIVLVAEIFNTALEAFARAFPTGWHPRIRDGLDMSSAAVLLSAATAAVIGAVIFGGRIAAWLGLW